MKVFQIRQDDRFAWYETDQEQMERMVNVCGWQGRVLELASAATADAVSVTASELSCVINWLEGGRDPKEAAKELRLYCERAWTGAQQGGGDPLSFVTNKNTMEKILWDFIEVAASFPEVATAPQLWEHLLVYAPNEIKNRLGIVRAQHGGGELPQDETAAFEAWAVTDFGNWEPDQSTFVKWPDGTYKQRQLQVERDAFAAGARFAQRAAPADDLPPLTMSVYGTRTEIELERKRRADLAQRAASVPAQSGFKWPNGCDRTIPAALRYLAQNPRPSGGEDHYNGMHLMQLADEMERAAKNAASVQGGLDWLGRALELEAQAKKVESKSARRAMEAGAHSLRLMGKKQPDIGRDAALLSAIRNGVPLEEPVSVAKAMMAQVKARVSSSNGTELIEAVFLSNIQVLPWTHTQGTATAYANGFNRGVEWLRSSIIEYADKLPTQAAPEVASVPDAVPQWRKRGTCQWYDGHPDNEDGGGPYETRTLYTRPQPALAVLSDDEATDSARLDWLESQDHLHALRWSNSDGQWFGIYDRERNIRGTGVTLRLAIDAARAVLAAAGKGSQ